MFRRRYNMYKEFLYENYQKAPNMISFEEAMELYEKIVEASPEKDDDFEEVWNQAISCMTTYAHLRAQWKITPKEERNNDNRTVLHDSVIHSLNQLSIYMGYKHLDNSWRVQLGDQRKRIGDFACYVSLIYGLFAR